MLPLLANSSAYPTLQDAIAANPIAFVLGLIGIVPATLWIVYIIWGMIDTDIETIPGILSITVVAASLYTIMNPPYPWLSPTLFLTLLLAAIVVPVYRKKSSELSLKGMDIANLEKNLSTILRDPSMMIARLEAGRYLQRCGLTDQALGICEPILTNTARVYDQDKREIRGWEALRPKGKGAVCPCLKCGFINHPSAILCAKCQSSFIVHYLKGPLRGIANLEKIAISWAICLALLIAIPFLGRFVSGAQLLFVIPVLLLVSGWVVFRMWGSKSS